MEEQEGGVPDSLVSVAVALAVEARRQGAATRRPRPLFLWELKPEHEAPVMAALADAYEPYAEGDLGNMLSEIAENLAQVYYHDHREDILTRTARLCCILGRSRWPWAMITILI